MRKEEQRIRNDAQTARRALREYPALFLGMEMAKRLQCNCASRCIIQRETVLSKFAKILFLRMTSQNKSINVAVLVERAKFPIGRYKNRLISHSLQMVAVRLQHKCTST